MPKRIENYRVELGEVLKEKLILQFPQMAEFRIRRQSIDARRRRDAPFWLYQVDVYEEGEEVPPVHSRPLDKVSWDGEAPLIVGAGPAGLFAALRFVERGIACHLFERGSPAEKRMGAITRYWRYGELHPQNNVCFGEGGAGLYSDGKLITRIKSPHKRYVLEKLVQFGAPEEILYLANPHVGSDRIRRLIPRIRHYLQEKGCTIHFDTPVEEIVFEGGQATGLRTEQGDAFRSPTVIVATGHSAGDMIEHLHAQQVAMKGKSFAVGFRVEHPQSLVNQLQYRDWADHPALGAANYKLTCHNSQTGVGVYSFCMCPGGYVIASGTEADGMVSNGMSNYRRNSPFANAAIVVTVDYETWFGQDLMGGMNFRRDIERKAHELRLKAGGTKEFPAQRALDFVAGTATDQLGPVSTPSQAVAARLDEILPEPMNEALRRALQQFDEKMKGFLSPQARLFGVESRTSCPVQILRDPESLESLSHPGLYPCGEGAGYAGGITSAAVDGIRVAEAVVAKRQGERL